MKWCHAGHARCVHALDRRPPLGRSGPLVGGLRRVLSCVVWITLVTTGAHAQGTAGVSTGQGLSMGTTDPYWHYIIGQVDYTSPGALLALGSSAVVDTLYDYDGSLAVVIGRAEGRDLYPWALRSRAPGLNINNGWLHPPRPAWDATPLGPTTLRTFVDLTHRNLNVTQLAGTVWADGQLVAIYVNGRALSTVLANVAADSSFRLQDNPTLALSRKAGYTFSIGQGDGLEQGVNVLDFVWSHYNTDHWLCLRVDFQSIFRETADR